VSASLSRWAENDDAIVAPIFLPALNNVGSRPTSLLLVVN